MTTDLIATVRLLTTSAGGRAGPTPNKRFGCIKVIGDRNFDVVFDLSQVGSIAPGQEFLVPFGFLDPSYAKECGVTEGTRFKLRELRTIGEGTVERLVWSK